MKIRLAKKMRDNPTQAEDCLWKVLKGGFGGVKWKTQVVLFGWIADFYAEEANLVVEVDGSSHKDRQEYDDFRDKTLLESYGVSTLRFTNTEILKNRSRALKKLLKVLQDLGEGM